MPKNYAGGHTSKVCGISGCTGPYYGRGLCHTHYFRKLRTGSPLTEVNPERQLRGKAAEIAVGLLLKAHGRIVTPAPHHMSDFDLTVDGFLVDVKISTAHTDRYGLHWYINFIHHGKLDESGKDFYVLRLEEVPYIGEPVHLLLRAPFGKVSLRLNMRHLVSERAAKAIADFYAFARGEFGQKEKAA